MEKQLSGRAGSGQVLVSRQSRLLLPEQPFPQAWHGHPDKLLEELPSTDLAFASSNFYRSCETVSRLLIAPNIRNQLHKGLALAGANIWAPQASLPSSTAGAAPFTTPPGLRDPFLSTITHTLL